MVRNASFDPSTEELFVDVEGSAPVWIDLDTLIAQYHGAGKVTKASIGAAIAKLIKDRQVGAAARKKEIEDTVNSLKGMRLVA